MGQVLKEDSVANISVTSATVVTMLASEAQTIGGGQFKTPILTCSTSVSGAGGIDIGSIAPNTMYFLYLVRKVGIISLVASVSSVMPASFPANKPIGRAATNASSEWVAAGNNVAEDTGKIGQIISAMLTEVQFQAIHGTSWILADGRNVAGSSYALTSGNNTVPDLRGVALRGKNNGRSDGNQDPDGERTLGSFQDHMYASHTHIQNAHNHTITGANPSTGNNMTGRGTGSNGQGTSSTDVGQATATNQNSGGNETRMRNVAVNHFIKIN